MKAFILAAGEGTRLRPLTLDRPKCLVPLRGRPLIDYQISALRECGIDDITLIGGYQSEKLQSYGLPVVLNPCFDSTNMVHSLFCARPLLHGDALLLYGDTAYEPRLIRSILQDTSPIAITVDLGWRTLWEGRMANPLADAETLRMNSQNQILEIGKKPTSFSQIQAQYMGLIRVSPSAWPVWIRYFDALPDAKRICMTDFLQGLIDQGEKIQGVPVSHGWLEVDSLADLEFYESPRLSPDLFRF